MILDIICREPLPFGVFCAAFLCFVLYWRVWATREVVSLTGAWVKAAAVGLVAVLLIGDAILQPQAAITAPMALVPVGLLFGAIGDFALARRGERAFLAGMAAFAVGHLVYAVALWARTQELAGMDTAFGVTPLSATQILALIGLALLLMSTEIWLAPKTGALRWPVRGYVLVIGLMAVAAVMLADNVGAGLLRLGAALFVLSDVLLAVRLFVVDAPHWKRRLSLLLWPAYWLGQMLLVLGAMGYGTFPKG